MLCFGRLVACSEQLSWRHDPTDVVVVLVRRLSRQAVRQRAVSEGWWMGGGSDVEEVIRRKVPEKVAGVVAAENQEKKAEAIDADAETRAGRDGGSHRPRVCVTR